MKNVLFIAALGVLSGCAAFNVKPNLDYELSRKGLELAKQTELVSAERYIRRPVRNHFSSSKAAQKLSILKATPKNKQAQGFQCFEPYFLIISLGLIPTVCSQEYEIETEWIDISGQPHKQTRTVSESKIVGWASIFASWSSDWQLGLGGAVESVVYDEMNRRAE